MKCIALSVAALIVATPASGQISVAAADPDTMPFFIQVNMCLRAFDDTARKKKLSPEMYRLALEGTCTTEIRELRGLYSLALERSPSQAYLVDRFDENVKASRARMVAAYVMN